MFYSETILSRRGPLGKVWLAAHMERKLSKTQTLQTDIEESVDAIMGQEIEVMALRLSGQLLLGVVRIYSRKAKYLLDDCNEALLKIKMAFRPGVVDMTEDQLVVNKTAITLQTTNLDLDLLLPDVNWGVDLEDRTLQMAGQHQARVDDITLRTADDFQHFDMNDAFDIGPADGIGSQDFNDLDLGINWGDEPQASSERDGNEDQMSVDGSIGVGRDAQSRAESVGSHLFGGKHTLDMDLLSHPGGSRAPSEHPFVADMDVDMTGVDLGDFGIGFDEPMEPVVPEAIEKTPEATRSLSRASSPLSEPPATPPPEAPLPGIEEPPTIKPKRKFKERKQIIDDVTEFPEAAGRGRSTFGAPVAQDVSEIITEQQFLPRSSTVMKLREIRDDPLSHFLPVKHTPSGSFFYAAPPGLAPELANLFLRPLRQATSQKRHGTTIDRSPNKRARLEDQAEGDDNEIEQARRAGSLNPSIALGSDVMDRNIALDDHFGGGDHFVDDLQLEPKDLDAGPIQLDLDRAPSAVPSELTQLSTPGPDDVFPDENEETYASVDCPIAIFDSRPSATQTQTQNDTDETVDEGKGYSRNTVKALNLVRKELETETGTSEKVLSFRQMGDKATRRAASAFFFELLVLGTRDCVQLKQSGPFDNIEVRAKPKLWTQQSQSSLESQGSST
ncbi:hypothetical protein P691DRAFT_803993 [Macrolepiota fuliginosa MF-IS2]|uniref:Double-strand-break repair protein rad21 n=1 Tax=Macrolepiota fuliginosa MF-IS2 TaxID=1400762 RepID=A0A9P6C2I9_9AGAR|nr:hypothetical protein P691DRAFT_803993 [Macrolepiota fuliginosa MF-IS2]